MPISDKEREREYKREWIRNKRNKAKIVEPVVEPIVEPIVEPVVEPVVEPIVEPVVAPKKKPRIVSKGEMRSRQILFYYKMLYEDYDYILWVRNMKRIHKTMLECFVNFWSAHPRSNQQ